MFACRLDKKGAEWINGNLIEVPEQMTRSMEVEDVDVWVQCESWVRGMKVYYCKWRRAEDEEVHGRKRQAAEEDIYNSRKQECAPTHARRRAFSLSSLVLSV